MGAFNGQSGAPGAEAAVKVRDLQSVHVFSLPSAAHLQDSLDERVRLEFRHEVIIRHLGGLLRAIVGGRKELSGFRCGRSLERSAAQSGPSFNQAS